MCVSYKLLLGLIFLDIIIVILHLIFGYQTIFFNLDEEKNIPAFYQGIKLIFAGIILLFTSISKQYKNVSPLFPLGSLLVYLGTDEILEIHEDIQSQIQPIFPELVSKVESFAEITNYTSSMWILFFMPFILAVLLYILFVVIPYTIKLNHRLFFFLTLGFTFFLLAILLEIINSSGTWSWFQYQILMILEESSEMVGSSILFYFSYLAMKIKK